ncbi:MAG: DivIVA domain-containing protein [Oscillospiraceae bacterium]|nr:DivIVA domain-containing protein [Oscillospiraceae bacterium]
MITAKDIRNKRFEKAAFGYKQEEIDEFLVELERELSDIDAERDETNGKLQILADKVREYMRDEDALKDALLGAQKQGHQVIAEANERAERIVADAQEKADALIDEATRQHAIAMEKNRAEVAKEREALIIAQQQVSDFKKALFDMYKSHLDLISAMPETFEDAVGYSIDDSSDDDIPEYVSKKVSKDVSQNIVRNVVEEYDNKI